MEKLKTNHAFEILSHRIEDGIYEGEILLSLDINSLALLPKDIEKQVLEVHFSDTDKKYICSMIHDIPKDVNDDFSSRYYRLNDSEKDVLSKYISENELPFLL